LFPNKYLFLKEVELLKNKKKMMMMKMKMKMNNNFNNKNQIKYWKFILLKISRNNIILLVLQIMKNSKYKKKK
jgi:hypothetical protein